MFIWCWNNIWYDVREVEEEGIMGMYDYFDFECVHCGKRVNAQTKITLPEERGMRIFKKGDKIKVKIDKKRFTLLIKEPCRNCSKCSAVRIVNNKIICFVKPELAGIEEYVFGSVIKRGTGEYL